MMFDLICTLSVTDDQNKDATGGGPVGWWCHGLNGDCMSACVIVTLCIIGLRLTVSRLSPDGEATSPHNKRPVPLFLFIQFSLLDSVMVVGKLLNYEGSFFTVIFIRNAIM